MRSLKELLLHYTQPSTKLFETENLCANIVSKTLNIKIQSKNVRYKNNQVSFMVSPTIKAEILLQKERIIKLFIEQGIKVSDLR